VRRLWEDGRRYSTVTQAGSPIVSKRARKRRGRKKNAANHGKKPNA
jgi:hypothetical protein